MSLSIEPVTRERKFNWILALLGATLLLAGSVYAADWMNFSLKGSALYPAVAKPFITLLAMLLVLTAGKNKLEQRDWTLLLLAFCAMLPTDILMSLVVVSPTLGVGGWVFMVGGVLSIVAHIFLILRVSRGWAAVKEFKLKDAWLPALIFGVAALAILILWKDMVRVGHAVIGPVYTAFFCTTMWLSWETVKRKLYPAPNAWMAAIAATCWFATEIFGEVFNLGLGTVSNIFFNFVWVFYGANVVLWALSGYRWTKAEVRGPRKPKR